MDDNKKPQDKLARNARRSRLIIRNLSFKITSEDLQKFFSPYGNIVDINVPKKPNGNIKGFAFISYDNVGSSLKAIKFLNGKKHFNRTVAVDFAVSKDLYVKHLEQEKQEEEKKCEQINDDDHQTSDDDDDDDEKDDSIDDNEDDIDDDEDLMAESIKKKRHRTKSDVDEGKTIFIRNIDLETSEESLTNAFESFGTIEYCRICCDDYNSRSKGSAFVKFKNLDDARHCLKEANIPENSRFYLDGKQLIITEAVSRNRLEQIHDVNHRKHKDKRNIYLAKEGLIYPESPAAVGVSTSDLKKRLSLEEKKRKLLQNLHYFISDHRLCIHNLPTNYDDLKLRKLFTMAVNEKNVRILWAKVMRNRSGQMDGQGQKKFGSSKGFGFVEFEQHSHALKALRYLNNNPTIFTADKRPIVEFSIENKVALNRKKYRQIKQEKMKNQNETIESSLPQQQQQHSSNTYSGVEAKPYDKNEMVPKLKTNKRKILEQKKKLKQMKKKMPTTTMIKRSDIKTTTTTTNDGKVKKRKKPTIIDADEFETKHLLKRSKMMNRLESATDDNSAMVKRKWFFQ